MTSRPRWRVVIFVAALACEQAPREADHLATPGINRGLVGCYVVSLGTWDRDSLQAPPQYFPPDTVGLFGAPVLSRGEQVGWRLAPNIFTQWGALEISPWWWVKGDSIHLRWSNGFGGVALMLTRADSGLVGKAVATTDIVRKYQDSDGNVRDVPWPAAPVSLRSVGCPMRAG